MKYNTATLPSGIRVILIPSTSDVVYCGYVVSAGSRHERNGEEGLAHFCEHVSFKGTPKRKASNILNELECVGGDLNAFTNKEDTTYYASVRKEHVARAVGLLTDIVFHSTYPLNEIDKEVEVICDEIESYNDSPAELIYDEFENTIFAGHPLGHNILGEAARVRSFTTADALRFTRRYYRPDNAVFFAYGDIDFQRMVRMLEQATSDLSKGQGPAPRTTALPPYQAQELVRKRGTHQAHVMIGNRAYDIHHPLRVALYLINNMLGGPGMNARLNVSLREHNGLVYTAESSMVSYGDTGLWCAYFGCDPHDVNRCRRLVKKELDRLIESPVSEAKLKAAKKQLKGQIGVACDNRESFALDFGKSFLHYGWEKDITSLYRHIDAVTAADIRRVAAELFPSDRLTTLLYL